MEFFFPRKEWNGVKIPLQVAATCGAVPGWGGSQIPTVIQPLPGRGRRDLSRPGVTAALPIPHPEAQNRDCADSEQIYGVILACY